ncbi:hypothetical protein J2Z40_002801 [Cytobacillus eiseniae]|uniref:Chemotaxis methyl-accepting receptor HlyB-like 4HB MCP domain-containing protein n=1 Tax=Cytobacillus eiseniae TaxID=762947 RepID=A0ABS4RH59_9BACI|nr:hypothetical protein [Cytobacillus eiseniae]MBP2242227.1 hypothetical protein [Cytobacillus eiseniae]
MKISWKYWITLGVVILLVSSSTAVVSTLLSGIKDNINVQGQRGDRAIKITEMGSLIRANHIRIITYIHNGSPQIIDDYEERYKQIDAIITELDGRMYTEEQITLFDQVITNAERVRELFIEEIVTLNIQADNHKLLQLETQANELQTKTVEQLEKLKTLVNDDRLIAFNQSLSSAKIADRVLLISIIISIITGGTLVFLTNRLVSRSLSKVVEVSNELLMVIYL